MSIQTYTVAQALRTTATGIVVADSPTNIANAVGNASLVSRVSLFTMVGDDAIDAYRAQALSTLGAKFSRGTFNLTIRDTVGSLTNPANAQGLRVGNIVQVVDTIGHLLPALNNPIIQAANTLSITDNATLTVAQLLQLESWPKFTAAGVSITLADTAANLLAVTPAQMKPAIKFFTVSINSTVSTASAVTLSQLIGFSIASSIRLTVADTLTNISSFVAANGSLAAMTGVVLCVADTVAHLTAATGTLASLAASHASMLVALAGSETVSASQLATLATIAHFSAGAGHTLTVADTMANLLALPAAQAGLVQASHLLATTSANVSQVQALAALPGFSPGSGNQLLVTDTVAHLAALTTPQKALLSSMTANDTLANLAAAGATLIAALTAASVQLDSGNYTIAQLMPLAALASGHLTLVPTGGAQSLKVVDTIQHLASGAAMLTALQQDGSVSITATDNNTILSASAAAALLATPGLNLSGYTLAVADTGSAIAAVAGSIFQHGFQTITVTSGTFSGTMAQLLDPTLTFAAGAAAQLGSSATVTTATLAHLAALPGFSVAGAAGLTVQDTVADLAAAEATVARFAAMVQVTDSATVSAAVATELATLRSAVGAAHFSSNGNLLIVSDSAADLLDPANTTGVALADALTLSGDSRVTADAAAQLAALTPRFSPGGATLIVADTGSALVSLAGNIGLVTTLDSWSALVMLSADSTLSVANAQALTAFSGFTPGAHHLILDDTAQDLLQAPQGLLSITYAVELSQPATLDVADATALLGIRTQYIAANPVTIADTPAALASISPALAAFAAGETLVAITVNNAAGFVIDAAQFAALVVLPNFTASGFTGQITLADTFTVLLADATVLANLPGGLAGHVVPELSADAVVSVSQAEALHALTGFTLGEHSLTISDTELNIAGLDAGTRAMATSIDVTGNGNGSYSAADFLVLTQASNFAGMAPVPVSDSAAALLALVSLAPSVLSHISSITVTAGAAVTAAQAELLSTLPNLLAGSSVTIDDSAANLLSGSGAQPDNWAGEMLASHITLTGDATLTAAQAAQLAQLGFRLDNGGHTLIVQDTPTALLAVASVIGALSGQISETLLADNATPWVVSIAQAERLAGLPSFHTDAAHAVVADNPSNILAPINATFLTQVPSVTLDGNYSVSVSTAQSLHGLANFSLGTHGASIANQLTISDGVGHLATLDAGTAAMASAIQLQGSGIASVAQFDAIRALPNYTDNGKLLLISDSATNLLTLVSTDVHLSSAIMLASDPSDSGLSAAQAEALATLPGFTPGIAQIGILDTAAHLLTVTGAGPLPDDWTGELAAGSVTLSQDATVTASQAAELALLGSRFSLGGHALTVSDTAANLAATANAAGLALASHIQLSGPETLTAAAATQLAAISGLSKGGNTVTVVDSAADLAFSGYAAGLALADTVKLGSATSLTVAAAEALIGMANFATNAGAPLSIADTLANLLTLASASLAHNNALLQATPIGLSADVVASVAQMAALAGLPEYASFSLNGHTLTVADTGRHLAGFTPDAIAIPTTYVMTGDATLTAAQADTLALLAVDLNGNMLTIADTPTALLNAANASGEALADVLVLSANASVDAATAAALYAIADFSTGGHVLVVIDTAQALLGMDSAIQQMASVLALAGSQDVDATTLIGLTRLGIKFSEAGHTLRVVDSAANLASLNSLETALTSAQLLSADGTVSAAVAAELQALPNFSLNGHTLAVQDTASATVANAAALAGLGYAVSVRDTIANVAANSASLVALGSLLVSVSLTDTAPVTATLAAALHVLAAKLAGNPMTVADGAAAVDTNLANLQQLGADLTAVHVTDTAANVAGVATDLAELLGILHVTLTLSGPIGASAAAGLVPVMGALDAATVFDVSDTGAMLQTFAAALQLLSAEIGTLTVSDGTTVSAAVAAALQPLDQHLGNGVQLLVHDTAAGIAAALPDLAALQSDGRLAGVVAVNETAADIVAYSLPLAALGAQAQIVDAAGAISANLDALQLFLDAGGSIASIALSSGTDVAVTLAQITADAGVLVHLPCPLEVDDNAALLAADLAGGSSLLLANLANIDAIVARDGGTLTLTATLLLSPQIDDGPGSVLSKFSGTLAVINAALNQLDALATLGLAAGTVAVAATAAAIQADLTSGSSHLLPNLGMVGSITADGGTISLTEAQVGAAGVDDGTGSVFDLLHGTAQLTVTQVLAADATLMADLPVAPVAIEIDDTAAHIQSQLTNPASVLVAQQALISGIYAIDGGTQTYTLDVASLGRDGMVLPLIRTPFQIAVQDTTADLQQELQTGAATLAPYMAGISSILASDPGTITLTEAQVTAPGIEDGANPVLAKLSGETLVVTGVAAADISAILSLPYPPASISVSDTAAGIAADLQSGNSSLVADIGSISGITITGGGTLHLTAAQLLAAGVDDGPASVLANTTDLVLDVTNVLATQLDTVAGLGVPPSSIEIVDDAAAIQSDLTSGSSAILANLGLITSITATGSGVITLDAAHALAADVDDSAASVFAKLSGASLDVTGVSVAQLANVAGLYVSPANVSISDTAGHIQSDLTGAATLVTDLAHINAIAVTGGTISLTESQAVAASVDDGSSSVFARLSGATLTVTNVLAADLDMVAGLYVAPAFILVNDTPADIAADLALGVNSQLVAQENLISSISLSQAGNVELTAAEILDPTLSVILAKLPGGSVVAGPVAVADIVTVLALGPQISSIAVVDDASAIESDLTSGNAILGNLSSIASIAANSGSISLTEAEVTAVGVDSGGGSALSKLTNTTLTVTGATIGQLATLMALDHAPDHIDVVDTAANITTDLASGAADLQTLLTRIDSITVSDSGNSVQLTAAEALVSGVPAVLAKLVGTLDVSAVSLASLDAVAAVSGPQLHIAISDTAANIEQDLSGGASHLATDGGLLSDVHASGGGSITLTAQQVLVTGIDDSANAALAHLSSPLVVTAALVGDLASLAALVTPASEIDVSDTAAHIQADLISGASHLLAAQGVLGPVDASDAGTITLTDGQATAAAGVLALVTSASLDITGVPVSDIGAMATLTGLPTALAVLDTAAAVEAGTVGGQPIATHVGVISAVAVNDGTLNAATAITVYGDLQGLGVAFDESNLTISDTAANLLTAETNDPAVLAAAHAVTLSADATGLSIADATTLLGLTGDQLNGHQLTIADSAANLLDPLNAATIGLASLVSLDSGTPIGAQLATQLVGLPNFGAGAFPVTIADSPNNLVNAAYAAGIAAATTVELNADAAVPLATLGQLAAIASFAKAGHALTLQDTASNVLATTGGELGLADHVDVVDIAANVAADLAALQTTVLNQGHALTITVSDGVLNTPIITVDAATYTAEQAVIDTITPAGIVRVTGDAADLSAIASTLANDAVVGEVDVSDTPTNILLSLPVLESIGSKFAGATVSGAVVNAAAVAGLLTIPNLTAGSLIVADSGSQIAAAIAANGAPGLTFLNQQTVQLNQGSVVTASDALALEQLNQLDKGSYTLSVWDTAAHLTDSIDGYLAAVSSGIIDHVYLRATGNVATITASTASTLFSIPHFNTNNPDTTTNVLTVQDTAAHLASAYATLTAHASLVNHVVVSASATVTDAVFGELLALGATKAGGVSITVRDTASAIIAGAPSQTAGSPSITATAWLLSGSATVNEAGIAYLAGLAGFSAGAYALTLSANATVSVADANAIAALGSAFHLGTSHLYLPGSIASMFGLSGAAQSIVVPQITDSFANVAQLLPSSGLLGGTITINDSESVTVTQAADFLALLKIGAGSGIPAANVSFGSNIETVSDTLANIQTLTGAASWTQNAGVHADFSLQVADTVANLVNSANLAALSAMAGTTLAGDQTTTAANAEALFAIKNTIHFGLDGHLLTVQDSAANLVDPTNIDGVDMASIVLLSASDTVSAVDAETLLGLPSFQINDVSTTLTISDTSDALLDAALVSAINASAYGSHLQVELAGPEVLDAQTAERLVSLPHFTNNGDLAIQDSASYLLNAANHDAEVAATDVALAGDELVSAATAVHLAAVPHFDLGGYTLLLASNDYADAATLKTLADFGPGFSPNGHTLTLTQDAINLTPDEYAAALGDGLGPTTHALSAIPVNLSVTATGNNLTVDGTGVSGATVTLYDANGGVLTTTAGAPAFEVTAADPGTGVNMVLTETVGASAATSESAPVILLEQSLLEGLVSADSASFAASGGANTVHVGTNEYLTLYDAASAPANPANPVLAYDVTTHQLLLDVNQHAPVVLVTLGDATVPAHLDVSEIIVKHQLG